MKHCMYVRVDLYLEVDREIPKRGRAWIPASGFSVRKDDDGRSYVFNNGCQTLEEMEFENASDKQALIAYHQDMDNLKEAATRYIEEHLAAYPGFLECTVRAQRPLPRGSKRAGYNLDHEQTEKCRQHRLATDQRKDTP